MAESIIKVRVSYADEATRDLEFGPFAPTQAAVVNLKTNIAAVNEDVATWGANYLSDGGATATGITKAQIITTNETVINLNDE